MTHLVELELAEGGSVLVEVEPPTPGQVTRGTPGEVVTKAGGNLAEVLSRVGPAVEDLVSGLRSGVLRPDEVEVEFAVKLSSDANVIIARTGGEANFRIQLRWAGSR